MKLNRSIVVRAVLLISLMASLTVLSSQMQADTGSCGGVTITLPFTDVMGNPFFCQIAAAYFSGLTNGTSATTYSPAANCHPRADGGFHHAHAWINRSSVAAREPLPRSGGRLRMPTA